MYVLAGAGGVHTALPRRHARMCAIRDAAERHAKAACGGAKVLYLSPHACVIFLFRDFLAESCGLTIYIMPMRIGISSSNSCLRIYGERTRARTELSHELSLTCAITHAHFTSLCTLHLSFHTRADKLTYIGRRTCTQARMSARTKAQASTCNPSSVGEEQVGHRS